MLRPVAVIRAHNVQWRLPSNLLRADNTRDKASVATKCTFLAEGYVLGTKGLRVKLWDVVVTRATFTEAVPVSIVCLTSD